MSFPSDPVSTFVLGAFAGYWFGLLTCAVALTNTDRKFNNKKGKS